MRRSNQARENILPHGQCPQITNNTKVVQQSAGFCCLMHEVGLHRPPKKANVTGYASDNNRILKLGAVILDYGNHWPIAKARAWKTSWTVTSPGASVNGRKETHEFCATWCHLFMRAEMSKGTRLQMLTCDPWQMNKLFGYCRQLFLHIDSPLDLQNDMKCLRKKRKPETRNRNGQGT